MQIIKIKIQKQLPQLEKRDKIYLLIKNLKIKLKSKKLNYLKIKPFFSKARKKIGNYKLKVSKNVMVYFVFNILVIKLVDIKIFILNIFQYQIQEENNFKVKKILD